MRLVLICAAVDKVPCGHSLTLLATDVPARWGLLCSLNCFLLDWVIRRRMGGQNLCLFVMEELPVLAPTQFEAVSWLARRICGLTLNHPRFAPSWLEFRGAAKWKSLWACSPHERLRLRAILEATLAFMFQLDVDNVAEILRDSDFSTHHIHDKAFARGLEPRGFWRYEKEKDPELRLAVLAQVAFRELESMGLDAFLNQNDGEGWMLPETLRLANYGLGHDDRAKEPQPVASRLEPRFFEWQLSRSVEESWEECERHAELLKRILPEREAREDGEGSEGEGQAAAAAQGDPPPTDLFGNAVPTDLFGNVVYPKTRKR